MSESDGEFMARIRAYWPLLRHGNPDYARLCDLAERQADVRAAQRTLIKRTEQAEADNTRLKGELADADFRAATALGHVEQLAAELAQEREERRHWLKRHSEDFSDVARLTRELDEARAEIKRLKTEVADLDTGHAEAHAEAGEARALEEELITALRGIRRDYVNAMADYSDFNKEALELSLTVQRLDALLATDAAARVLAQREQAALRLYRLQEGLRLELNGISDSDLPEHGARRLWLRKELLMIGKELNAVEDALAAQQEAGK